MGALGVLRAWAGAEAQPPRTLALVDWADEEGARFGRSLFGSSAAAGTFDPAELANARDADGRRAPGVLAENGVELERVLECRSRLERLGAYLELHIEQGPVLEAEGIRAAAVSGCVGVERLRFVITGPRRARRDDADGRPPRRRPGRRRGGAAGRGDRARARAVSARSARSTSSRASRRRSPGAASMVVDLRHRERGRAGADARGRPRGRRCQRRRSAAARSSRSPIWRIEPIAVRSRAGRARPRGVRAGDRHRLRAAERRTPRRRLDGATPAHRDGLLPLDRRRQPRARGGHRRAGPARRRSRRSATLVERRLTRTLHNCNSLAC